jgi:hypothetical protein
VCRGCYSPEGILPPHSVGGMPSEWNILRNFIPAEDYAIYQRR